MGQFPHHVILMEHATARQTLLELNVQHVRQGYIHFQTAINVTIFSIFGKFHLIYS